MELLKRDTDYALRAALYLAAKWGGDPVSTREIAEAEELSYDFTCKLMQRLSAGKLVKSVMGSRGGYKLAKDPAKVKLSKVIEAVQGPIRVNKCIKSDWCCTSQKNCPLHKTLLGLQKQIDDYFDGATLSDLLEKK